LDVSVEEHRKLGIVVPSGFVENEGVSLHYDLEPLGRIAGLVPNLRQIFEREIVVIGKEFVFSPRRFTVKAGDGEPGVRQ
jgi:hypothetical protein